MYAEIHQRVKINYHGELSKSIAYLDVNRGEIKVGEMSLACCVLGDGRRLISENAINSNLGSSGGKTYRLRDAASTDLASGPLPLFLASKALQPFIPEVFDGVDLSPIEYNDNGKIGFCFDASILPKVCEVWLMAAENKKLQPSQLGRAKKAEIISVIYSLIYGL